ncbi:hypothetical protein [Bacillus sp. FJAT-29937]|uniref:hypothetical protein n=1 Tax=Bacillus sp. FJAT-29937 TaxID=1720553 RepID=UPI0012E3F6B2|nr:hypothetical protein [Bacillus sp. FJAT-29937]
MRVLQEVERRVRVDVNRRSIKSYLDARFGLESKPLQDRAETIMELDLLEDLLRNLYRTDNHKVAEELVEAAIDEQQQITNME